MATPRLDKALREHYDQARPAESTVERWDASARGPARRRVLALAAAAATLGVVAAIWLLYPNPNDLAQSLAAEVWEHHQMRKSPKIFADSLESLGAELNELGFELHSSPRLAALSTVGGRYCSLGGQKAAQITLEDSDGSPHTLYVTRFGPDFEALDAFARVEVEDGHVDVWVEKGLVYARAHRP